MCGFNMLKMATTENFDLLQPEILSTECLLELLKKKCVPLDGVQCRDRAVLEELYYRCIIPLPQRTYRRNRRGQQMTNNQVQQRKRTHTDVSAEGSATCHTSGSRLLSSYEPKTERLKPPPSAINFSHKVIKLGTQITTPVAQKTRLASQSKSDSSFDFVINSKPRSSSSSSNGDSSTHSSVSDLSYSGSSQNNGRKTVCKTTPTVSVNVKLHRAVKMQPSPVTPMDVDEDGEAKCNNTKENDMDTTPPGGNGKVKPHRRSAVSLINKTLEMAADNTKHSFTAKTPTRTPFADEPKSDDDGDVLRKKFRKIAVQWP